MRLALPALLAAAAAVWPSAALADPPPNDAFANAQVLTGTTATATGDTTEATGEPGEPIHGGSSSGHSVWYRWTAPAAGGFIVDTCASGFDTVLAVYTGASVEALTQVVSNDDSDACASLQSRVRFEATAGIVYSIAVDGSGSDTGQVGLSLRPVPPPPVPAPGLYGGTTDFGERVKFTLNRAGTRITRFEIAYQMNCARGFTESRTVLKGIRVRNGRFAATVNFRFRGGARQRVRVAGMLVAPRRARGNVKASGSFPGVGRCRTPFSAIAWTAIRR